MTANELLKWLSWCLYLLIFAFVAVRALRRPTRASVDTALLFGDTTAIIVLSTIAATLHLVPPIWLSDITGSLLMALPYLLLRLVADFSRVPWWLMRATELGLACAIVAIVILPDPMPTAPALLLVGGFLIVTTYVTWAFVRQARRTSGVTRRRLQSIAVGTVCLGLLLLIAGLTAAAPGQADLWTGLSQIAGVASGIAYFAGFAPPTTLRRAWQEPELLAALHRAAALPHLPDTRSIVDALETNAAASLGAHAASLGLWDAAAGRLRFYYRPPTSATGVEPPPASAFGVSGDSWELEPQARSLSGRAFMHQQAIFVADIQRADPDNAERARAFGARSGLAAPITAGNKRLGVLVVYAQQEPVFAESDLELLRLLSDQAAVILESRMLLDEAMHIQAREESLRLKEDFLSSAAHQVKTPLTGILTQAQLLLRQARIEPIPATQTLGLERIVRETRRLTRVLVELFDATQLEASVGSTLSTPVDLVEVARELTAARPRCHLEAAAPVIVLADRTRISQLLEHLIANALLYDPTGGEVRVRVWSQADRARVSVVDRGIGIPSEDLPYLFGRFHRGRNVDDRRFAGLGLGLYVSRQIAEQHGGRVWVSSQPAMGSTFDVELPLVTPQPAAGGRDVEGAVTRG